MKPKEKAIRNNPLTKKDISSGVVHKIPADLREALTSDPKAFAAWEDLTPLARHEWICWVISVKNRKPESSMLKECAQNLKREYADLVERQSINGTKVETRLFSAVRYQ